MSAPSELVVSADGPLSVNCRACGDHVAGTQYPTTEFHIRTLETLREIHSKRCKPAPGYSAGATSTV